MDIRNSPKSLEKLYGCRVIEGFLQILLMDRYETETFEPYSFPELVEVTGFVLLYRVNGLMTLRKLFPNLAVIRGDKLFDDNALVIYEMLNMEVSSNLKLDFCNRLLTLKEIWIRQLVSFISMFCDPQI